MSSVYESVGGTEGLLRLAEAWHQRVLADEVVAHAFSHGYRSDHTPRLAAYWTEALGGPNDYSSRYGDESAVIGIHSGNGEHEEMNRRAISCFDQAMADVGLSVDVQAVLHDYFAWAAATTMYNHSGEVVPDGLPIPQWTWSGLVSRG